jgi:hypothetical protein
VADRGTRPPRGVPRDGAPDAIAAEDRKTLAYLHCVEAMRFPNVT